MANFQHVVDCLSSLYNQDKAKITREEYAEWQKKWLFDCIAGKRLGQSFCEYFGIGNATPLYHFKVNSTSERWIRENHLDDKTKVC